MYRMGRVPVQMLRRATFVIPALACAVIVSGCDKTEIIMDRPDSGSIEQDGGTAGPLALVPGMVFTYQGRLTARGPSQGDEKSSVYTLTVTIDAVTDLGASGDSRLSFSVTGANQLNQDWTDVFDFSSWVARLGPALRTDQVGAAPLDVNLSQVPQLPSRANPKVLPTGSFFIDMRKVTDLRVRFAEIYADSRPRVVDPSQNNGTWLFEIDGEDPTIITYEVQRRKVRIEYDPRGFITRIDETIGETGMEPTGSNTLILQTGP